MILYKLIGNQSNIYDYINDHKLSAKNDWTGTYLQDNIEHA